MVGRLKRENLDVIIGSRFLIQKSKLTFTKRLTLRVAALFEKYRTGLDLTDAHNGLRALNLKAARLMNLNQNRMAHASEITSRIAEENLLFSEHPVEITYSKYSKSKGQSAWNSVNILSELWIK